MTGQGEVMKKKPDAKKEPVNDKREFGEEELENVRGGYGTNSRHGKYTGPPPIEGYVERKVSCNPGTHIDC